MSDTPISKYHRLVEQCEIHADSRQLELMYRLNEVFYYVESKEYNEQDDNKTFKLFSKYRKKIWSENNSNKQQGLYIWGGVGRGKTMLMDLFFDSITSDKKKRVHFHSFMKNIHEKLHVLRAKEDASDGLLLVAKNIAAEFDIICFDEFQVHDIADAMVLSRLFEVFFESGMIVIFTSNRPPEDLYLNGLQRKVFLPFIEMLNQKTEVFELASGKDYRMAMVESKQYDTYIYPLDENAHKYMNELFARLSLHAMPSKQVLEVMGHDLVIDKACHNVAWFEFEGICKKAYGAGITLRLLIILIIYYYPISRR